MRGAVPACHSRVRASRLLGRAAWSAARWPPAPWVCLCLLICAAGCQSLGLQRDTGPRPDDVAAAPQQAPRTIPLELIFARFEEQDATCAEELWSVVDEQVVDDGLRRELAANGLRIGVVTGELPPHLAARLLPDRADLAAATATLATEAPLSQRLLRLLPGRRSEIVAAAGIEELVLLETTAGQVRGGTFRDATGVFELKVRPAADGRVRLDLVPEIKHGPLQRSVVGTDGMFRMEAGQRRHRREDLACGVELREGGLLIVGCGAEPGATLGDALLRDRGGDRATMRLLAIRPLGKAVDPLFSGDAATTDTATAGDDVLEVR